tara:strand:- start:97 stop:300 length:204 start_codon:yes stop_codon:yes gene_type:complete
MPFNTPPSLISASPYPLGRSPSDLPTNRELINKIDNDITILRGEVMELRELMKQLLRQKESKGWIFS